MIKNKMGALAGCAVLALGLAACGSSSSSSSSSSTTSSGAGDDLRRRLDVRRPRLRTVGLGAARGLTVNYQAVGSGAGITAIESKTVDFGASDPPLKPADEEAIAKNGSPAVQIPMFLGAITVSYNLPGVKTGLKLEGKTIANIFLGKIKTWNDAEIKALNPGVTLPSTRDHGDPPLGLLGHDLRLHQLPRRRSTPNARARSAKARPCSGRRAPARRATRRGRRGRSRPPARSATSSRHTRSRTTSPSRR